MIITLWSRTIRFRWAFDAYKRCSAKHHENKRDSECKSKNANIRD